MRPTDRFVELIGQHPVALDQALLAVAAHDHTVDEPVWLGRLDDLSADVKGPTLEAVRAHLFDVEGFSGDTADYHAPENSFLDSVIERRQGMPITLAVVTMEVGRRAGVMLDGVGMPGHFLVRDRDDPTAFLDPFHQGQRLDPAGCQAVFERAHPGAPWSDDFLAPVEATQIVNRVLLNLQNSFRARQRRRDALWAADLTTRVPGASIRSRIDLIAALAAAGRFDAAADEAERLADGLEDGDAAQLHEAASRYRACLN